MQQSDAAGFQALLTDALAFYRQDVSDFALSVRWQACKPFSALSKSSGIRRAEISRPSSPNVQAW